MKTIKTLGRLLSALLFFATASTLAAEWCRDTQRQSVAMLSEADGTWRIVISFRPVTSFGEGKNLMENSRMARDLAEWGLWKELGATPEQILEVSGMEKTAFTVDEQMVHAVFLVSKASCRLVPRPVTEKEERPEEPLPEWPNNVTEAKINNPVMERFFREHPFLMETGGAKLIRQANGEILIVSIGMIDAAKPPILRRKMAENRARTALLSMGNQIHVYRFASHSEQSVTNISGEGEETGELCEESAERIESKAAGWLPGLPVAGTWILKDDNMFCFALGEVLTENDARRLFPSAVVSAEE